MKKTILIALLATCLTAPVFAGVVTLFSNKTGIGPRNAVDVRAERIENWACDAKVTGNPTVVVVRVEGNQGGSSFDPTGMASHTFSAGQLTAKMASFGISNSPIVNMRANLVTFTNGSTISVKCGGISR